MFAPGPWHVGIKQAEQIVYNDKGWAIANATVYHGKEDIQETKDNARLIAAAPEMYALLSAIKDEIKPYFAEEHVKIVTLLNRIDGK
jgi:hypothetical protein